MFDPLMVPDLPELPAIREQSLRAFRTQDAIAMRLPGLPKLSTEQLTGYSYAAQEAAAYAEAVRIAFEITRRQKMIENAKAREANRIAQRLAERRRAWWR